MHNRRRLSLAAMAMALLQAALPRERQLSHEILLEPRKPRGWRNPFRRIVSANRYAPHQGPREMARRVGGETWAMHQDGDRARRGLPPIHTR